MFDDILKFQHGIEKRANALSLQMVNELNKSFTIITGKLAALEEKYLRKDFDEETFARRKALLEHQREEVEKVLKGVYSRLKDQIKEAGQDVFQATTTSTIQIMNSALGLSVSFFHLDEKHVQAWFETATVEGLVLNEWLEKLERNAVDRIISAQRQAMIRGASVSQTVKLLREQGFEGSYKGLQGLARTMMHSASHVAREKTIQQGYNDLIEGWEYVSTLDSRTCLVCGADDGKIFKLDAKKPSLPRHWRCRCCYIPKLKPMKGVPDVETSRPAVAGDEVKRFRGNYQGWMRHMLDKDPDFVKEVLGPKRFELFKAGKLTLDNMVTDGRITRLSRL